MDDDVPSENQESIVITRSIGLLAIISIQRDQVMCSSSHPEIWVSQKEKERFISCLCCLVRGHRRTCLPQALGESVEKQSYLKCSWP